MIGLLLSFAGIVLSAILVVASLWQIEICTCWAKERGFDMPFYLLRSMNWAVARDLWYAVNVAGWMLGVVSGGVLGWMLR
jgi:hypothetical protein